MPVYNTNANTWNTTPIAGVDVTQNYLVYGSAQTSISYAESDWANPPFTPGQIVQAGGAEYIFAQVSSVGSINQYDCLAFIQSVASTYTVTQMTSAYANVGVRVGWYQGGASGGSSIGNSTPSTGSNWVWVALRGSNIQANITSTTTANLTDAAMYISTVPGYLGSASASTFLLRGVTNEASTGNAGGAPIIATWPMITTF